ncbi:hypothetical protein PGT21_018040 [Puccinia graminis f. sp. tritici]|uniref:CCHC-type domain-containing protein n=1 Tax=Puccinia graminis f. sp. tritici TaxID=56615 RepID=A0A5B0M2W9_PUCGR|nr:hypothetical protein PGT21_018040 [Puccinia graminis f. sp. tritici]KAA1089786.1 hypothetical protein PGTUg99_011544 [Puccinia graminis f. sp. tritici]
MLPTPRPPDPIRPPGAPHADDLEMNEDSEVQLPSRPSTKPPSSSLHILLTKALGESATQDANGAVVLKADFVELLLDLSANNKRMMRRREETIDKLNARVDAKVDPVIKRLAEVEMLLKNGSKTSTKNAKSFASAAASTPATSIHAPTTCPPSNQTIASLKPKRVIIHSNPASTTLKDVPSCALVQKVNEALLELDAKVDGERVAIRGASLLPSGDVSFYTKDQSHQNWLMANKHVWSKAVHPDLEATPSTYSVMAHGIPKSFDIGNPANLARLASENSFQAVDLVRVRWMGSNEPSAKKAGSIILSFTDKDLAYCIEKSGIFLNYDFHRTDRFKPRPPQCFKCLKMGHFGKWCREPAKCAKCSGKHSTNKCPEGLRGVTTCVLCKDGLKNKVDGISSVDHTPFSMACPYKKAWFDKKRPLSQ